MVHSKGYSRQSSYTYDQKRFTTPAGKLFHRRETEQLLRVLAAVPAGARVLEVGCGTGRFLELLAARGYCLRGVDPSIFMLEMAAERVGRQRLDLAEGARLPYSSDTFDFCYSIRVTNQTESRSYAIEMIEEMIRVTKPGGTILIEFVNAWRPRRLKRKCVCLSVRDLKRVASQISCIEYVQTTGAFLLSMTLFSMLPSRLLPVFDLLDRVVCWVLPSFAARCYTVLAKGR